MLSASMADRDRQSGRDQDVTRLPEPEERPDPHAQWDEVRGNWMRWDETRQDWVVIVADHEAEPPTTPISDETPEPT